MILFSRSAVIKTGTISVPLAMSCETQSTRARWKHTVLSCRGLSLRGLRMQERNRSVGSLSFVLSFQFSLIISYI